jgi:hypothetical protein
MKLRDVYVKILKENALGLEDPKVANPASRQDMEDALEHMADYTGESPDEYRDLSVNDFVVTNKIMTMDELSQYDDFGSWPEWQEGELAEMDEEERMSEIDSFRGSSWANRAKQWIQTGRWPTIVVVELDNGYTAIGDGRGRVSLALGLGVETLPVSFMKEKP